MSQHCCSGLIWYQEDSSRLPSQQPRTPDVHTGWAGSEIRPVDDWMSAYSVAMTDWDADILQTWPQPFNIHLCIITKKLVQTHRAVDLNRLFISLEAFNNQLQRRSCCKLLIPGRGDWKCGSGKCDTGKIARVENAGVENARVDSRGGKCRSKPYGTPTRDYIETALSYFVILVLILLTE